MKPEALFKMLSEKKLADGEKKPLLLTHFADELSEIGSFLEKQGYHDVELAGMGSTSLALKIPDNNDYVFVISPGHKKRPMVPYVTQPFFSKTFPADDGAPLLKLQAFLNIAATPQDNIQFSDLRFARMLQDAGYEIGGTRKFTNDCGVFHYGKYDALMAMDAGLVEVKPGNNEPRCTSDYPPLEVQWRKQCDVVRGDERLQRLVGGMEPPRLPPTKIVQISKGAEL